MDIAGWWTALGVTFIAVFVANAITDRAARLRRLGLNREAARSAYVHIAPEVGGGLAGARAIIFARVLPNLALLACGFAFCSAIALTIFPKYATPETHADLYHALNAPYYVGLSTAYLCIMVLMRSYLSARSRRRPEGAS